MRHLFGTDGIRGIAGQYPLVEKIIYRIPFEMKRVMPVEKIVLGNDTRGSSEWIEGLLMAGCRDSGILAETVGSITTPGLAKIVSLGGYHGGIMISASHNPAEFNGIKILSAQGEKLNDGLENAIEDGLLSINGEITQVNPAQRRFACPETINLYRDFLLQASLHRPQKPKRIVLDCSNGGASSLAEKLFRDAGYTPLAIHCSPNGKNINHGCGALHPEEMARAVVENGAFAGFAFDGDADRLIMADGRGSVMNGDQILHLLAHLLMKEGYRGEVVGTVMSNLALENHLKEMGLSFFRTPVGDRYVWERMVSSNSRLGGETSGHIILRPYQVTGDGLLAALKILDFLESENSLPEEYHNSLSLYSQILVNLRIRERVPLESLGEIGELDRVTRERYGSQARLVIRYSGTEPLLRLMAEGEDEEGLKALVCGCAEKIRKRLGEEP